MAKTAPATPFSYSNDELLDTCISSTMVAQCHSRGVKWQHFLTSPHNAAGFNVPPVKTFHCRCENIKAAAQRGTVYKATESPGGWRSG